MVRSDFRYVVTDGNQLDLTGTMCDAEVNDGYLLGMETDDPAASYFAQLIAPGAEGRQILYISYLNISD
jgi:hypothetical protein